MEPSRPSQRPEVAWLEGLPRFRDPPGLEPVRELLEILNRPERSFRALLVAGTNGKGTTATGLAACLREAGLRTGLFTGPHLHDPMERFLVDGRALPAPWLVDVLAVLKPAAAGNGATFFQVLTAAACALFERAGAEVAVFEAGMGGRFDATNALDPDLSIVTGVERDHAEILGPTLEAIAEDKAGVFRSGVPAVTAAEGMPLVVLDRIARRDGVPLRVLGRDVRVDRNPLGWAGQQIVVSSVGWEVSFSTPLPGAHFAVDLALATEAARLLGVPSHVIARALSTVHPAGRMERVAFRDRRFLLDGAHNPAAAEALVRALCELGDPAAVRIVGISRDKDAGGLAGRLAGGAERLLLTAASRSRRALPAASLQRLLGTGEVVVPPAAAVAEAVRATAVGATVLVAGSLYLVAEVREVLGRKPFGA